MVELEPDVLPVLVELVVLVRVLVRTPPSTVRPSFKNTVANTERQRCMLGPSALLQLRSTDMALKQVSSARCSSP